MRSALVELNEELERDWGVRIESRIGVNTGEVVAGEGDSLSTGDAVNVAARLEQGLRGETLLGESTHRLVRDAVEAELVEPLDAKGKSDPVAAFRLVGLVEGAEFIPRRLDFPWSAARTSSPSSSGPTTTRSRARRVPVHAARRRRDREVEARARARRPRRCQPARVAAYRTAKGSRTGRSPRSSRSPARSTSRQTGTRSRCRPGASSSASHASNHSSSSSTTSSGAEPTFLDLVDHITDLARDAPLLLLCVARPELLDHRPGWGGGKLNATTMLLEALTADESTRLVDNLLLTRVDTETKERIAAAAEGNPLFVEEMLAMVTDASDGELAVPPTIQALLAARLDRLTPDERTAVECAAVQGQEFRQAALASLVPEPLAGRLAETSSPSSARTSCVRPTRTRTASSTSAPRRRARSASERAARGPARALRGLDRRKRPRARGDPRLPPRAGLRLSRRARARRCRGPRPGAEGFGLLASAGRRAEARSDVPATINLLERAVKLLPDGDTEAVAIYPDLGTAVAESGDLPRAEDLFRRARELGDPRTALVARQRGIWNDLMRGASMAEALGPWRRP